MFDMEAVHVPDPGAEDLESPAAVQTNSRPSPYRVIGYDGEILTCPVREKVHTSERANLSLTTNPLPADANIDEEGHELPEAYLTIKNFQGIEIGEVLISGFSELHPGFYSGSTPYEWLHYQLQTLPEYTFTADRTGEKSQMVPTAVMQDFLEGLEIIGLKFNSYLMGRRSSEILFHYDNRITRRDYSIPTEPKDNPKQRTMLIQCDGESVEMRKDLDIRDRESVEKALQPLQPLSEVSFNFRVETTAPETVQIPTSREHEFLQWTVIAEQPSWDFLECISSMYDMDRSVRKLIDSPRSSDAPTQPTGDSFYVRTYGSRISARDSKVIQIAPVHFIIHKNGVLTITDESVVQLKSESRQLYQRASLSQCVDVLQLFAHVFNAVQDRNSKTLDELSRQLGKFEKEESPTKREEARPEIEIILASVNALESAIDPSARIALHLLGNDLKGATVNNKEVVLNGITSRISEMRTSIESIRNKANGLMRSIIARSEQRLADAAVERQKFYNFMEEAIKAFGPFMGSLGAVQANLVTEILPKNVRLGLLLATFTFGVGYSFYSGMKRYYRRRSP